MSVSFVECRRDQLPALQGFFRSAYRDSYRLANDEPLLQWQFGGLDLAAGGCHVKLAVSGSEIQACLGFIPVELSVAGTTVRAAWTANWMVAPSHRRLGLGPMLLRQLTDEFDAVLSVGLEADACELLPRMGWRDFGDLTRYVCVLDIRSASRLTASGTLTWPASPAVSDLEPVVDVAVDAGVNDLWDRVWGETGAGTRRSVDFLKWRYLNHPRFQYRVLRLRSVASRLEGLGVFRIETVRDLPITICRIAELVADPPLAAPLIRAVIQEARASGAAIVDFACSSRRLEPALMKEGFLPGDIEPGRQIPLLFQPLDHRRTGIRFMAHLRKVPQAASAAEWYATRGDGDQDRPN